MNAENKLSRNELYDMVWEQPITHLAKKFGITAYQLNKICKKYRIPKPLPGYWQKVDMGKKVSQRPLVSDPDLDHKPIIISPQILTSVKPKTRKKRTVYIKEPISITETCHKLHPLVAKTKSSGFEIDREREIYGLRKPRNGYLNINVTPRLVRRALMLADTIIKAIEGRGHKLEIDAEEKITWSGKSYLVYDCYLSIKCEKVRFKISEKLNRVERSLSKEDKEQLESYRYISDRWRYVSSGLLRVKVLEADYRNDTWMDNDKKTVEEQIPLIIYAILFAANRQKQRSIERKHEEQRRAEEKRIAIQNEELEKQEQQSIDDLMSQVNNWEKSVRIRKYLEEFECIVRGDVSLYDDSFMKYWIKWAHDYADNLDPLTAIKESSSGV